MNQDWATHYLDLKKNGILSHLGGSKNLTYIEQSVSIARKIGQPFGKEVQVDDYFTSYIRINSRQTKEDNCKSSRREHGRILKNSFGMWKGSVCKTQTPENLKAKY